VTSHILTHTPATLPDALDLIDRLRAELLGTQARLISPGWQLPIAGETLYQLQVLLRSGSLASYVDAALADIDNLKEWNTATGSEHLTDSFLVPGLTLRVGDCILAGKRDDGDMFLFLFPAGMGEQAMAAKHAAMRNEVISQEIRNRYVWAVCHKYHNADEAERRYQQYLRGESDIIDYPTMTTRLFAHIRREQLEHIFFHGDREIFEAKALGQRGTTILHLANVPALA
jgi:hypothetical protein